MYFEQQDPELWRFVCYLGPSGRRHGRCDNGVYGGLGIIVRLIPELGAARPLRRHSGMRQPIQTSDNKQI